MFATSQVPIVSYQALHKASRITKYIYQFYFPLHGISPKDIFNYYPTLTVVESIIYQADLIMENSQDTTNVQRHEESSKALNTLKLTLISLLQELDLYDYLIEKKLSEGEEFIKLENELMSGEKISHANIMRLAELRSSDVRLLHCILFRMMKKPYNQQILSLVWPIEVIADIEDDFKSYAHDVSQGRYNTYQMFVKLYGNQACDYIKVELENYENLFYQRLADFPVSVTQDFKDLYFQFCKIHCIDIPQPILI